MELKFKSLLHLEITPKFGWWYSEDQTATWMSYDTRIQNILQRLWKHAAHLMRSNRLFNRDLSVVNPMITFLFAEGNGSLPMNSILSLIEIGSVISNTILVLPEFFQHFIVLFVLSKGTGGDFIELELLDHVAIPFNGNNSYFAEYAHSVWRQSWLIACGKESLEGRHIVFFTSLDLGKMRLKKNSKVPCRNRERYTARLSGNALMTPSNGFMWSRHKKEV